MLKVVDFTLIHKYYTYNMSVVNGEIVGLLCEFIPVILVDDNGMLESFTPVQKLQIPLDWSYMTIVLSSRDTINVDCENVLIDDDYINKLDDQLRLEPGLLEQEANNLNGRFMGLIHKSDGMKIKVKGELDSYYPQITSVVTLCI